MDIESNYGSSMDATWMSSCIADGRDMSGASSRTMDHCRATWSKAVWLAQGSLSKACSSGHSLLDLSMYALKCEGKKINKYFCSSPNKINMYRSRC